MRALALLLLLPLLFTSFVSIAEPVPEDIKVYHDPECQCCHRWINHLKENKFNVLDIPVRNMSEVQQAAKVPKPMEACHTATIDGYIIEGHVPAAEIYRLLAEKPDIKGLSVPKMPIGSPGMEAGDRKEPFIVFQFDKAGKFSVFSRYEVDENNQYQIQLPNE